MTKTKLKSKLISQITKPIQFQRKAKVENLVPGEITYVGENDHIPTQIDILSYNTEACETNLNKSPNEAKEVVNNELDKIHWISYTGLKDVESLKDLGQAFKIHSLVLEDIANTKQRPRLDEFKDYVFFTLKMIYHKEDLLIKEHFALILGPNYVISFQENKHDDILKFLRERIANNKGRIRNSGSDYLFYAIIDAIVDNYYNIAEIIELHTEHLEDVILQKAESTSPEDIQTLKRQILNIRKSVSPTRELIGRLQKTEHKLFRLSTKRFLADLYDHILQVTENIAIYREIVWGLMDMYMSSTSNSMNQVMKVLTIMSTIFIPLTFIVGVYGMNFKYMPELEMKSAYYMVWTVMLVIALVLVIYFKRKKWF